jgi:purine nucleosidase
VTAARRVPVLIDTDCGVDDAAALWWALTSPTIEVVGISCVWGNVDVAVAAANVCRILHETGHAHVPVTLGLDDPIGEAPSFPRADFIHGTDGIGNTNRPAAPFGPSAEPATAMLSRLVDERPGELTLVTLGPLSNVGALVRDEPSFAPKVRELVVMGGAAATFGNALPSAEANIGHDPVAADLVARSAWGMPPLLVGLDVTHTATLTDDEFALMGERRTPAAAYMDEPLRFYRTFGATFTAPGECPCHDLLATMAASLDLIEAPVLPMAVQATSGPAWGATVVDHRIPIFERSSGVTQPTPPGFAPWRVGLGVDVDRFRAEVRSLFGG